MSRRSRLLVAPVGSEGMAQSHTDPNRGGPAVIAREMFGRTAQELGRSFRSR